MIRRPEPNEYNAYFSNYIGLVPEGDLISHLERHGPYGGADSVDPDR